MKSSNENWNKPILVIAVIAIVFFLFMLISQCKTEIKDNNTTTTIDTTYVDKTITIPGESHTTENDKPTLVKEKKNPSKVNEFKVLPVKEQEKTLDNMTTERTYTDTYVSGKDSLAIAKVTSVVNGEMVKQTVEIVVKDREETVKETIIEKKTETKLKPTLILSGGLVVTTSTDPMNTRPSFGIAIGAKIKELTMDAAINTNKNIIVTVKQDLLTFWKKDKK